VCDVVGGCAKIRGGKDWGDAMDTCFVMQPFDGAQFDQRFEEVYAPAIRNAQLEPYRVDQDPSVSIPIQEIESGIRQARVCLAEITLDNPNVWFELGYAIACKKEVVLICSDARTTKFPFDVQHRTIIKYSTGSPSDFDALQRNISTKLRAYLEKSEALASVSEMSQLTAPREGFAEHEVVALAAIAQNLGHEEDHAAVSQIQRDMESNGFTRIASTLALKGLTQRGYVVSRLYSNEYDQYYGYELTPKGWDWVLANQERFSLQEPKSSGYGGRSPTKAKSLVRPPPVKTGFDDMDDDIPF
jgi:nucleoside 2-deoxyribosyltransferase